MNNKIKIPNQISEQEKIISLDAITDNILRSVNTLLGIHYIKHYFLQLKKIHIIIIKIIERGNL